MKTCKTSKVEKIETMMSIFHDAQNVPSHLLVPYYNLAKDIYGDEIRKSFIIFKSEIVGVNSFKNIITALDNYKEQKAISLRYGLDGSSPKTLFEISKIFNVSTDVIRQMLEKILHKLRHANVAGKCTTNYAKQHFMAISAHYAALAESFGKSHPLNVASNGKIERFPRSMKIEELGLSVRSYNALTQYGITTVGQIVALSLKELKQIKNLGAKSINEIQNVLYFDRI